MMAEPVTKPIDFRVLQIQGARKFGDLASRAQQELTYYQKMQAELTNWANRPDMNQASITFKPRAGADGDWPAFEVFIPPFLPHHYEGDSIVGPFGTSEWATWEEAKEFHDRVIAGIWAGEYGARPMTD